MTSNNNHGSPAPMSCAEFQEQLPDLFASGSHQIPDGALHEHLGTCDNCSALVRDLQYIAEQASLLLQQVDEDPSDDVWKKIQESIDTERTQTPAPPLKAEPV
ncbi:hypothetical protein [Edaphobacter bradus]|uniref:hypothetical protein n=1 Tax=Edaphobacter bradus TaxID=2259016 RepID=UPI0021E092F3|nr:hypothetical protein [Edaphobacter bradus]